jgi:hypothetical protein
MKLVIAVSHVDLMAALRQMAWIGFLSERHGNSMLNESLLLVVSRRAAGYSRFKQLCWLSARIFGESRAFVPDEEHETAWPGAANWMFSQALCHAEHFFPGEDIFFLEPDGTPLFPHWYDKIQEEWMVAQENGKNFMGAYVPHDHSHMTGIAVYGHNWRTVAPSLVTSPDRDAWDTWSAPEVVPNCHFVKLIQHVFRRHEPGWSVPSLAILDKDAVLFHQDKKGKLVYMLDHAYHGGECAAHPLFGYSSLSNEERAMRRFYYAQNVTRAIVAHGRRFQFEALDCHGGSVPGAFSTDLEADQAALSELTSNPTTGVVEISAEEWENCTKKKVPQAPSTSTSKPSSGILPQAALLPTPSKSPAVLVAEPSAVTKEAAPGGPIKDIADVIKTDTVQPAQTANIGTKLPRPENKKKPVSPHGGEPVPRK